MRDSKASLNLSPPSPGRSGAFQMLPTPGLGQRAGAGIERHLVRGAEVEVLVAPEDVLRAVAVVHVEVDHGDALGAVLLARIEAGDGDVGEDAEAHGALVLGVMAAGAHLAEHVGDAGALVHHAVDGGEAGADRPQRRLPGLGRQHRVGIEMRRRLALGRALALDPVDVGARMGQRDGLLHVVPQRRLLALQALEQLVGEHLVDGAHAVGPLGVAEAGVVLDEAGVGEEEGGHWRVRGTEVSDPRVRHLSDTVDGS